jgi:hypothetical protein
MVTFVLTVQGAGGPKSATVTVTVSVPQPDTLTLDQAEFRTRPREFRLAGTVAPLPNLVIARTGGFEIGRAAADATGVWSIRRTLLASELALTPTHGATTNVSSKRALAVAQFLIRN